MLKTCSKFCLLLQGMNFRGSGHSITCPWQTKHSDKSVVINVGILIRITKCRHHNSSRTFHPRDVFHGTTFDNPSCKLFEGRFTQVSNTNHNFSMFLQAVPKYYVWKHKMMSYNKAVLHFNKLSFTAELKLQIDRQERLYEVDLVMEMDWMSFGQQTGITEGEMMRFQVNLSKCLAGEIIDFDVC